jgi:cephalosporin-C deacetylase-like acetyl esterase
MNEFRFVEPDFQMSFSDKLSRKDREVYQIRYKSWGDIDIYGWYARPSGKGNWPAVLEFPGHGGWMEPQMEYRDLAVLSLDIRGHGMSRGVVDPGFPGYLTCGIEQPETYIYRGAFMDSLRGVEFLRRRSEVNPLKIGVSGISQGGALALVTAALDGKVCFCTMDVPFLSDFVNYLEISDWPASEFNDYLRKNEAASLDNILQVLSYFDIKNHAPQVTVPVLMATGLMDSVCPPRTNFAVYNAIPSEKSYIAYPMGDHNSTVIDHRVTKKEWILKQLES